MADRFPDPFPPPFAGAWGDDAHGLWTEFELRSDTASERVVQRVRWIEPGTFLMGSPADEPERLDNEGPRHRVTLTRGFWLADSACTQALWRAVMGTNPSHFIGDEERPVEQVSWDDVQRFLRALEALLPGCVAGLPTETQWEYACRAGSDTPFSFGAKITPEAVNYDGNFPYVGGEKGLYRGETVPVKTRRPTPGVSTRCMATSGSGAPMACADTMARRRTQRVQSKARRRRFAACAAAPGSPTPFGRVRLTEARTPWALPAPAWAFACA